MDKNYSSIYRIKDFAVNEIAPKYFNMEQVNDLNIGLLGYTTELVSNLTEDNFNTVTTYMNEMFPNLAVLPESIYSYASLFQTDGSFATSSELDMMIFLAEDDIIRHATPVGGSQTSNDKSFEFFLDSNMIIDVEGIQFMPDYDIRISFMPHQNDYIFTAAYNMSRYGTSFDNTISNITNPYIRIKRIYYNKVKYLIMLIKTHQVNRFIQTENVLSNDIINTPTFNIEFDNQLASFEIFYKDSSTGRTTQLIKRLAGTTALKEPFCYYKIIDENRLEISFSNRDNYFQPKFNSELYIEYYMTSGEDGNFPLYNGTNITVIPSSDTYVYNNNIVVFAIPQSASVNGKNRLTLEELRRIVIEKYSTVDSYTDENDLQMYFSSFKELSNTDILFIKKRDDIFERLFTAFSLFKNSNDDIFHTNTLNMKLLPGLINNDDTKGSFDIEIAQNGIYILKPGHMFEYADGMYDTILPINQMLPNAIEKLPDKPFLYTNPFLIYFSKSPAVVGYYLNTVNNNYIVDYEEVNNTSFVQFICNSLTVQRNAIHGENTYKITIMVTPTTELTDMNPIVVMDEDGNYTEENVNLKVRLAVTEDSLSTPTCYIDLKLTNVNLTDNIYTYTGEIETNDVIMIGNGNKLGVTNMKEWDSGDDNPNLNIPMTDCKVLIYTQYRYSDDTEFITTNTYSTNTNRVTFVYPISMIRSRSSYINTGDASEDYEILIKSVPLVRASTMIDPVLSTEFYSALTQQYNYVYNVLGRVTNNYSVDMKFYNTYGKSKNFRIGDNAEDLLDKVNISLKIKVRPIFGTSEEEFIRDLKIYIKNYIESINDSGTNSIYISNLIQSLENDFPNLSYMKFVGINDNGSDMQVIENTTVDLTTLTKEERIDYVPEYLTISLEDIKIDII